MVKLHFGVGVLFSHGKQSLLRLSDGRQCLARRLNAKTWLSKETNEFFTTLRLKSS
jgi:hypothetical protein